MPLLDRLPLRWRLLAAFGVVLLIVAIQGVVVFRSTVASQRAEARVEYSLRVLDRSESTLSALNGMQSGYRGFSLTGDEAYLAPYDAGRVAYREELAALRRETADNPEQLRRWDEIERRAASYQEVSEPGIVLRREVNAGRASLADVEAYVRSTGGKQQFDAIRNVIAAAKATEDDLLAVRAKEATAARAEQRWAVIGGTAAALLVAVLFSLLLARDIGRAIGRLATVAGRIADGDLDQRVGLRRGDEIGRSADAFDRMAERLQAMLARADAATARAKASETRTRAVLDNVAEGIFTFDEQGALVSLNPAAERMFDTTAEAAIGRNLGELVVAPTGAVDSAAVGAPLVTAQFLKGGQWDLVGRRGDGLTFPLELMVSDMGHLDGDARRHFIGVARDVGERRRAEVAIRHERDLLQALMDNVPDLIFFKDSDSRFIRVNRAYAAFAGLADPAALVGKTDHDLFPSELAATFDAEERHLLATGEPILSKPEPQDDPSGQTRWLLTNKVPLRNETGRIVGLIGTARDISDQMAIEQTLERERLFLAAVLEGVDDGIVACDANGTLTLFNRATRQMHGLANTAIPASEWADHYGLFAGDGETPLPMAQVPLVRALRGETVRNAPMVIRPRQGEPRSILAVGQQLRDGDDRLLGAVVMMHDVTEQRQAEVELDRRYQAEVRARGEADAVLDAAGDGMIMISPERLVVTANHRLGELFEVEPGQLIGQPTAVLTPLIERAFGSPELQQLLRDGLDDERRQFSQMVTQRWPLARDLELFSSPVHGPEEEYFGRLFTFRDVTRQREVDRMKSEFVSLVSHELRTPLTSIKGYVELMLGGEVGEVTPPQHEFLTIVANNADRLVALINDLLDISRIESGKLEFERQPVDLRDVLGRVAVSFRPQLVAKDQHLTLDLPEAMPRVLGDADRLTQVFTNLVSNAHKYTPRGGHIRVHALVEGDLLHVEVQDSGIGLSPEEQSRLFDRFYRASNRTTQEVGGTGLGLSITRSLIELHTGTISVESTPGEGSTFCVTLPTVPWSDDSEDLGGSRAAPSNGSALPSQ